MRRALLLAALIGLSAPAFATSEDLRSVAGMKFHNRVLLVFAPNLRDPRLEAQRQAMARFAGGALERDLVLVQVGDDRVLGAHDDAPKLRRHFQTPPPRFRALLIDKNGQVALDAPRPVAEADLRKAIDAMPIRREEIRRAKAGEGRAD